MKFSCDDGWSVKILGIELRHSMELACIIRRDVDDPLSKTTAVRIRGSTHDIADLRRPRGTNERDVTTMNIIKYDLSSSVRAIECVSAGVDDWSS